MRILVKVVSHIVKVSEDTARQVDTVVDEDVQVFGVDVNVLN